MSASNHQPQTELDNFAPPLIRDIDGPNDSATKGGHRQSATSAMAGHHAALSNIFSNFLDNLSAKLPPPGSNAAANGGASNGGASETPKEPGKNIRRTSDLLETLQRALANPPPPALANLQLPQRGAAPVPHRSQPALSCIGGGDNEPVPCFAADVEIQSAANIERQFVRLQRSRPDSTGGEGLCGPAATAAAAGHDHEPYTYVTFEARGAVELFTSGDVIQSPDGKVYTTAVAERTTCPQWQKRFEAVQLPVELLTNPAKRFVLKVWRKASVSSPQMRAVPTPYEDSLIGYVVVNLAELRTETPAICDWFNVTDVFGRVNGRLQMRISATLETLRQHQGPKLAATAELGCIGESDADSAADSSELNQTIKRKFTELEDITKRLKARLGDVTDDANFEDILDEFENDLNTMPDEATDSDEFDWMMAGDSASERKPSPEKIRGASASTDRDGADTVMMVSAMI